MIPKISVIMSVYNGEEFLQQAIESILNQSYVNFEFIIVNDGSTDKSDKILGSLTQKDPRIKIISRENKGLVYSLNEGVRSAQGEYIARMDADDISMPDRLEKQLSFMEKNNLCVCGTWAEGIDFYGNKIKVMDYPPGATEIKFYTLQHNPFIHPTVMFRKDIFDKVGRYKKIFEHAEDYELWTRVVFKNKTDNIPEKLLKYRLHDKQVTKQNKSAMRTMGVLVRVLSLFRYIFRF